MRSDARIESELRLESARPDVAPPPVNTVPEEHATVAMARCRRYPSLQLLLAPNIRWCHLMRMCRRNRLPMVANTPLQLQDMAEAVIDRRALHLG